MENEKPRLSRLTTIITQLQAKQMITASHLAEKHQVSIRTIYRDIRTLQNSGIPIVTVDGKGYSLLENYRLPPVMFTESEANALITAQKIIAKNKDQSLIENYSEAITKIKAVLKLSQKDKVDFLAERIQYRENESKETSSNLLMDIQNAIINFQLLEIKYQSLKNKSTIRIIEPFAIYSTQDNWLLIAYCRLRNDFRAFRIDLIQDLHTFSKTFEPHNMTLEEYFEVCRKKYLATPDTPLS